jgi:Tol biopolymer transport system component
MRSLVGRTAFLLALISCASGQRRLDLTGAGQGLTRITSDKVDELGPTVSADGTSLLFDTRLLGDASAIIGVDPSSGARRTVYTPSTSRSEQPAYARQGTFFVYSSNSPGTWSLVRSLSNSPNGAISIVVSGENAPFVSNPDISPSADRVAFATSIRRVWNIGVAHIDGSNFTLFGEGSHPKWSPDGKRLAFVRVVNDRAHIFIIDVETGSSVVQVTQGENDNSDPAWSPDGRYIVFTSNRSAHKAPRGFDAQTNNVRGEFNLFAVHPDGTGLVQLTSGTSASIQPTWANDGYIYFASNQVGNFDIWRLRPTGELLKQ